MIEVRHGSFGYKKQGLIFKDINFQLEKGDTLSILGPNGVGKTTLLKCLLGFLKLREGDIQFCGQSIDDINKKEFFKCVSYVPQAKSVVFPYSVLDMVLLGRSASISLHGKPSKWDMEKAIEAIEQVGISHLLHKPTNQISGGELQLVLIARSIVNNPEVLILDEPESNLDMKNQLIILELLENLKKDYNLTVIINTHYPNHALRLGGKSLIMGYGYIHQFGNTTEHITYEALKQYFHVESKLVSWQDSSVSHQRIFPIGIIREALS
ncbi:MAG: ABC transporter ATP-binding protein [Thermotaleaceae bacterium]